MSRLKGDPGYRGGWCIHYRPSSAAVTTCEAGVDLESFYGTKFETRVGAQGLATARARRHAPGIP